MPSPERLAPRSLTTTFAPSWARAIAIPRPIPRPDPVTSAVLPSSIPIVRSPFVLERRSLRQRAVVRVTRRRPLLHHAAELRAHRIDAANGHRPPSDHEVVRRERPRGDEVPRRRLITSLLVEPQAKPELRAR